MQNSRQYTFIQNYRHAKSWKHNIEQKLHMEYIRNRLERSQSDLNENEINLPRVVTIKLLEKIKVRHLMNRQPLLFHIMLKQGIKWYTLAAGTQETL